MDLFPITAKTFEFKCTFQKQKYSSFRQNDLGEIFKQLIFSENKLVYCKRQMNRSVKLVTKGLTQWVGLFSELCEELQGPCSLRSFSLLNYLKTTTMKCLQNLQVKTLLQMYTAFTCRTK